MIAIIAGVLAQSPASPTRVIPNRPDLTIRTQTTFDHPGAPIQTTVLQFKGARERLETGFVRAGVPEARSATITQCDLRRMILLNDDAETFAPWGTGDKAKAVKRAVAE